MSENTKRFAQLNPGNVFHIAGNYYIKLKYTARGPGPESDANVTFYVREVNAVCPYTGELVWVDYDSEVIQV